MRNGVCVMSACVSDGLVCGGMAELCSATNDTCKPVNGWPENSSSVGIIVGAVVGVIAVVAIIAIIIVIKKIKSGKSKNKAKSKTEGSSKSKTASDLVSDVYSKD